ncbi:MAG: hypothetical protein PHO02_06080 [Candidatus Nanoarchaeia archaeon]|nr:hypothetical protein [Candidatus Nanoarchaeia archaeon]
MEFIVVYYRADGTHAIKEVESIKAKDMETAFERTQNGFAVNMVIPRNKKNKEEIEKLLKMF